MRREYTLVLVQQKKTEKFGTAYFEGAKNIVP
jgi:hypothetical protein